MTWVSEIGCWCNTFQAFRARHFLLAWKHCGINRRNEIMLNIRNHYVVREETFKNTGLEVVECVCLMEEMEILSRACKWRFLFSFTPHLKPPRPRQKWPYLWWTHIFVLVLVSEEGRFAVPPAVQDKVPVSTIMVTKRSHQGQRVPLWHLRKWGRGIPPKASFPPITLLFTTTSASLFAKSATNLVKHCVLY